MKNFSLYIGFEPTTFWLTAKRSTTELTEHIGPTGIRTQITGFKVRCTNQLYDRTYGGKGISGEGLPLTRPLHKCFMMFSLYTFTFCIYLNNSPVIFCMITM